ncbi:MAG: ATPase [Acidobacteria bacterium]|nr:MAG: ATPase [Acidobacteriota bacterium]
MTPDPQFIYHSRTHSKAFDSLIRGLEAGCGFLVLIAKPGMGKTTLLLQLLEQLERTSRTVFLFQTQCDSRELFRYLLSGLGLDATGQDIVSMHERLNQDLARELLAGLRFVLVIDECQNLDNSVLETVRLLSNFETPKTKLIQIVLAGQTQFADKLSSPSLAQLRQRISILCRLEPLAREEIVRYIEHRLQVAGHAGAPLFSSEALEKIATYSEGIPRNINNLCFNSLLLGYSAGCKQVDSSIIAQVLDDLEMNPREPKCVATQQELQTLLQPPVILHPNMFKADLDSKQGESNDAREIVVEFETTPPKPAPLVSGSFQRGPGPQGLGHFNSCGSASPCGSFPVSFGGQSEPAITGSG